MQIINLDATNKSITAVLAGAPATTNPDFTASYADSTATTLTEGANDGALNGTTPVTIVAAPAASTRRIIKSISIQNRDTAAVVLTVRYVDGANTRQIWSGTLAVGDTWTMDGVMNALGSMKTAFAGSHTALSDIGTNTHAQIDTHIANITTAHGLTIGTFTATLSGVTTTVTATARYTKIGNNVTISIPSLSGESNWNQKTISGMPAALYPSVAVDFILNISDNGGARTPALGEVSPSGVIAAFTTLGAGAWTASGTTLITNFTVSYSI